MSEAKHLRTLMEAVGQPNKVIVAVQQIADKNASSVGETWPYISGELDDATVQNIITAKQGGATEDQIANAIEEALYDGYSGDDGEMHPQFDAFVEDARDDILWTLDKYVPGPAHRQAPQV